MKFTKPTPLEKESTAQGRTQAQRDVAGLPVHHQAEVLPETPCQENFGAQSALGKILDVLSFRRRLILSCFFTVLLMGWLTLLLLPRYYSSEAKLMIRIGRESISLDPTATTSQTLLLQKTQEEEVNSALEILSSRIVVEEVVDELGAGAILDGSLPTEDKQPSSLVEASKRWCKETLSELSYQVLHAVGLKDDISDRELAVMKLQKSISIYAPKKTAVVTIQGESNSPKMAQEIVRCLISKFLVEHLKVSKTEGSLQFFVQQAEENEQQLSGLLNRRKQIMKDKQIASVESKRAVLTAKLANIDQELLTARSEVEQAQAEYKDLQQQVSATKDEIVASKLEQSDRTWSAMRNKMYELEIKEGNLASAYTSDHPKLVQIREQLDRAKEILADLQSSRVDQSKSPNPIKTRIQEELRRTQSRIAGLRSLIAKKETQQSNAQKEIRELLDHEIQLSELERNISVSEHSLSMLREKQEEARVIEELQSQRISNITVFQEPTFVERPVSPRKKLLGAAFVMLGLVSSLGLGFWREISTSVLRTSGQVEGKLQRPVVATIPHRKELAKDQHVDLGMTSTHFRNSCHSILSEILYADPNGNNAHDCGKILGIISVDDGCGASSLASSLALASSQDMGVRTALIDADLINRSVSRAFELNGAPGITELLANNATYVDCQQERQSGQLSVFSCSAPYSKLRLHVDRTNTEKIFSKFREANGLTVIDLPPANRLGQAMPLAIESDFLLVVIRSEQTESYAVEQLMRKLELSQAEVAGFVLNNSREYLPRWVSRLLAC